MQIYFNAVCVSRGQREFNQKQYFNITVEQDEQVLTIDCSPEVYKAVEKYKSYLFRADFSKGYYNGKQFMKLVILECDIVS